MFKNCSGKGGNLMLEGKSKVNFFYASCSIPLRRTKFIEIGKSVTLGELCLLRHKIIKNPLWDESAQSNISSEY